MIILSYRGNLSNKRQFLRSLKVSYPELLPHVHLKNFPQNYSSPSNMVCKSIVEFPSDFSGAISHGVFIKKRHVQQKTIIFDQRNQSLSGKFDIAAKETQQLHLLSLLTIWCQVGSKDGFLFSCQYILPFPALLLAALGIQIYCFGTVFRETAVNAHFVEEVT